MVETSTCSYILIWSTLIIKIAAETCIWFPTHYADVITTTIASQITNLTVVYSTVYSDADQRKHQSSASLAFVWGIHRDRWIPRTKGQLRGKCFNLMTSSWCIQYVVFYCGLGTVNFSLYHLLPIHWGLCHCTGNRLEAVRKNIDKQIAHRDVLMNVSLFP